MKRPLMPKSTALWLIENTTLTFDQIAAYCALHPLEVQGIADGDVAAGVAPRNPVENGELDAAEIGRCQEDPAARLEMKEPLIPEDEGKATGPRYTPVSRRQDRPDAVSWLLKNYPELTDSQISRLVGTTKETINKIRDREHWNMANITPRDPVLLDLCSRADLQAAIDRAHRAGRTGRAKEEVEAEKAPPEAPAPEDPLAAFAARLGVPKSDPPPPETEPEAAEEA